MTTQAPFNTTSLARFFLLIGLLLLAFEPAHWLINTWRDDAYDSAGLWAFLFCIALLIWSATSPRISSQPVNSRTAFLLLGLTALTRLLGQLFAINTIGAIALVIDIYALALLLATPYRARPLSPFWLAILFAFSLPVERIVQRIAGYFLQEISADVFCQLISIVTDSVHCHGTRIEMAGQQFLIDLPCSGTNSLVLLGIAMTMLMVIVRPNLRQSLIGFALIPILALSSNILRIMMLVLGSTYPQSLLGIAIMEQPWHELTGLASLLPSFWILFWYFKKTYKKPVKPHPLLDAMRWNVPNCIRSEAWWIDLKKLRLRRIVNLAASMSFVVVAGFIVSIQGQAMDVSHASTLSELPMMIHQHYKHAIPLLAKEQAYFTQYGGDAKKAIYGDRQLLLTKTSSPLRHLHSPDECLRGLGFKVSFLGSIDSPIPSSIYKATSPNGEVWKVAVSFVSQHGYVASNVSEAVWKWMKNDRGSAHKNKEWLSLQRISPWESDFKADRRWDAAVLQALELPLKPST